MICESTRGPDRRLVAEHRADHLGVPARVGLEVVLDLGDVALEARAQREQAGHLLGEELRGVRLRPVDPGGAAHDDRPHRRRLLAAPRAAGASRSRSRRASPCGGQPGPGCRTIWLCTTVSTSSGGISFAITGLRMSASMHLGALERELRRPARVEARHVARPSGSRSRRAASSAPRWLPTPVISTRRPAISRARLAGGLRLRGRACAVPGLAALAAVGRACAAREALLDRVEPAADRAQLGLQLADVLVGGRPARVDRLGHRAPAAGDAAARPPCAGRPTVSARSSTAPWAASRLRPAEPTRGLDRALHRLAQRRPAAPSGVVGRLAMAAESPRRPLYRARPCRSSIDVRPIHLRPATELAERVLLPGDPHRALAVAQDLLEQPLMFNHARGLWGYTGTRRRRRAAVDPVHRAWAGPSAAIVMRGADRPRRQAARPDRHLAGPCSTTCGWANWWRPPEAVLPADGVSAALGAGTV